MRRSLFPLSPNGLSAPQFLRGRHHAISSARGRARAFRLTRLVDIKRVPFQRLQRNDGNLSSCVAASTTGGSTPASNASRQRATQMYQQRGSRLLLDVDFVNVERRFLV